MTIVAHALSREDIPQETRLIFIAKIDYQGENACWPWLGHITHQGYGSFAIKGKSTTAHRAAVAIFGRSVPAGMTVDHLCRNPSCVNPAPSREARAHAARSSASPARRSPGRRTARTARERARERRPVAMINAEGAKGHQYADEFDYTAIDITGRTGRSGTPRRCAALGLDPKPAVVIIDSMSHMHDGPGGLLEYHSDELDRMAGGLQEARPDELDGVDQAEGGRERVHLHDARGRLPPDPLLPREGEDQDRQGGADRSTWAGSRSRVSGSRSRRSSR
jgi:hypothetical protein